MTWIRSLGLVGLGVLSSAGLGRADDSLGPIDNLSDLQDTGKILFKLADQNNDGQISQAEAVDAGNLMVGGFFFLGDTNGDGVLSKEELTAAREKFLAQRPLIRLLVEKNRNMQPAAGSPAATAATAIDAMLDSNRDGQLQSSELRQMVQTGVAALYASADTNRDGQMSPAEVNAAIIGLANAAAQAAFAVADTDRNGQVSQAEFDKAIVEPAHAVFRTVDLNNDGQVSPQEAQAARQAIMSQVRALRVAEPGNSAKNIINGVNPAQVAPVPNFVPQGRTQP